METLISYPLSSAIVIDYLKQRFAEDPQIAMAYVYCEYKQQRLQTPSNLVSSIWRQLSEHKPELHKAVQNMYSDYMKHKTSLGLEKIKANTIEAMRSYSKILIVVDALDECTEQGGSRSQFIKALQCFLSNASLASGKVQLIVTSRLTKSPFEGTSKVGIQATDEDLRKLVERRFHDGICESQRVANKIRSDKDMQEMLINAIIRGAQRMCVSLLPTRPNKKQVG